MDPTPAYLAIKNDPDVILCEHALAAHRFMIFALMGRDEERNDRILVTEAVVSYLRKPMNDERVSGIPTSAAESPLINQIRAAMDNVLSGLVLDRGTERERAKFQEYSVSATIVEALRDLMTSPALEPWMPSHGAKFHETKCKLHGAQGLPLPPPLVTMKTLKLGMVGAAFHEVVAILTAAQGVEWRIEEEDESHGVLVERISAQVPEQSYEPLMESLYTSPSIRQAILADPNHAKNTSVGLMLALNRIERGVEPRFGRC